MASKTVFGPSGTTGVSFQAQNKNGLNLADLEQLVEQNTQDGSKPFICLCVPELEPHSTRFVTAAFDRNEPDSGPGGIIYLHVVPEVEPKLTSVFSVPLKDTTTNIELGIGSILISYGKRGGVSVNVDALLKDNDGDEGESESILGNGEYKAAVGGFTALLLALAGAGVDFEEPTIQQAVCEAVESIGNEFGDDPVLPKPLSQLLRKTGGLLSAMDADLKVPEKYIQRIKDQRKAIDAVLES
jgi:hypothetical protein